MELIIGIVSIVSAFVVALITPAIWIGGAYQEPMATYVAPLLAYTPYLMLLFAGSNFISAATPQTRKWFEILDTVSSGIVIASIIITAIISGIVAQIANWQSMERILQLPFSTQMLVALVFIVVPMLVYVEMRKWQEYEQRHERQAATRSKSNNQNDLSSADLVEIAKHAAEQALGGNVEGSRADRVLIFGGRSKNTFDNRVVKERREKPKPADGSAAA